MAQAHEEDRKEMEVVLSNISAAEKEEFRGAFKLFDKDGDGAITVEEIHAVFTSLGFKKFAKADVAKMVNAIDVDGNGTIDLDEFILLLRKKRSRKATILTFEEELKQAFQVFDIDGNGTISADELSTIMQALGESLTTDDINFMIKAIDINSDGQIDFDEFKKMMQHAPIAQETMSKMKP